MGSGLLNEPPRGTLGPDPHPRPLPQLPRKNTHLSKSLQTTASELSLFCWVSQAGNLAFLTRAVTLGKRRKRTGEASHYKKGSGVAQAGSRVWPIGRRQQEGQSSPPPPSEVVCSDQSVSEHLLQVFEAGAGRMVTKPGPRGAGPQPENIRQIQKQHDLYRCKKY